MELFTPRPCKARLTLHSPRRPIKNTVKNLFLNSRSSILDSTLRFPPSDPLLFPLHLSPPPSASLPPCLHPYLFLPPAFSPSLSPSHYHPFLPSQATERRRSEYALCITAVMRAGTLDHRYRLKILRTQINLRRRVCRHKSICVADGHCILTDFCLNVDDCRS